MTTQQQEAEVRERVRFHLNEIATAIENEIKRDAVLTFEFALDDLEKGMKFQYYREAFEKLQRLFKKEAMLPPPSDNMWAQKRRELRDKCVDAIMRRYNEITQRRLGGEKEMSMLRCVVDSIEQMLTSA